ncbi:hypothetical protein V6N00_13295 [Tersicoccus sp. MR15.9]|uniref:hypothetical protein n=1 Tax=Tersicoccus mangrovi TaxID=3121635 RepID=UPI002FE58FEE
MKTGVDTVLGSSNGSPEISIPAGAATGQGSLSVAPADGPDGRKGWHISLAGAQLTGPATIRFRNAVTPGKPAPLVGFNENPGDPISYDVQSHVDGSDVVVTSTHFSNWFTDGWDWLMGWAKDHAQKMLSATAGGDPKCDRESEAMASGLKVTSGSGDRVKWCVGKSPDGSTVLKVNNSRSYGVSLERTPGLTMTRRGENIGDGFQKLIGKITTSPSKPGNAVDILGPGETAEYRLGASASTVGVKVDPSPPAYLATALWFGVQTAAMAWSKVGKVDLVKISEGMDALDCAGGLQSMSTAQVTSAVAAADYLTTAIKTVMPCTGKVFKKLAKGVLLDVVAVVIASTFAWIAGGIETAINGIKAAIDTATIMNGYQIVIRPPAAVSIIPGLPAELNGKWCTRGTPVAAADQLGRPQSRPLGPFDCFVAAEWKKAIPDARVIESHILAGNHDGFFGADVPGATDYTMCLGPYPDDACPMYAQHALRYFPAGVAWDCTKAVVGPKYWPRCEPDYTALHDPSQPRLVTIPNHQQARNYYDSRPMYRVGD